VRGDEGRGEVDELLDLGPVDLQHQGLSAGKVPVESAGADAGCLGDRVQRRIGRGGQGLAGYLQNARAVLLRIGSELGLGLVRHLSAAGIALWALTNRRCLR